MFDYEVEDCRLQGFLKKEVRKRGRDVEYKLRMLVNCGTYGDKRMGVHVLANGIHSKVLGVRTCNHSWVCPYCTARKMSKYAAKIEAAIEALKQREKLVPVMVTFTIFHTIKYSAGEMFDLLTRAYWYFNKFTGYSKKSKITGKTYGSGAVVNFFNEFGITHKIKACEITYGEHGWHPHYHMLYFVPKNRVKEVGEWEERLQDYWNGCVKKAFLDLFSEDWSSWSYLFNKYMKNPENKHKGLYITKDSSGEVAAVSAAQYCCGFDIRSSKKDSHWGAEKELTGGRGLEKIANEGHYTPRQMLEAAYAGDKELMDKYIELCLAVIGRRQHRVEFSRTGIRAIIIEWMNTQGYKEYIKKKNTAALSEQGIRPFYTVCWFSSEQWSRICDTAIDFPYIQVLIRRFAICEDVDFAYRLICELMETFHLSFPLRYPPFDISVAYNAAISGEFDSESNITALDVWKKLFKREKVTELVPLDLSTVRVGGARAQRAAASISA